MAINIGDIRHADWWAVRAEFRPHVVTAGFPCTDISVAGKGEGIHGERSGIWKNVRDCVQVVRPGRVFLENVAVIRSRGLDVVAEDLAEIGYDLRWTCLRASEVGFSHPRHRWFGYARPAADTDHG
jgi:DNA (cytosine-5)-methyltransferase 1